MKTDYTLYFVTEESAPVEELLHTVESAVKGGVTIVQLREKQSSGKHFFEKALKLKSLLDQYEVPLIINDRIDIALAVNAAGIHIGQSDLPLSAARNIVPDSMIVGVSVSTIEEAEEAERNGANYIGVGAVFPTSSKDDAKLLPKGMLEAIIEKVSIPVVAIGGIKIDNLLKLPVNNISGYAIVSGIMKAENPYSAAKDFRREISLVN
ncbi:thiamine phosphate synthase [Bacillus sp. DTU_2020_1000418_1_SI_GHA_SEK_038]|uniref:thiamine phosphate synthase n=1 Tax=Bacillus sp. DTU_2020_1000418_1_SI_GHA_SEK_038 TaxID=3077585 RepID=UPI0028EB687B|nr:thiamine phosphate synthase [Bacillus sp. DTU_2020_1000418_1_SI_GHA_SEK_038]WNS77479.1 thiamine phosphate synthase [Bacillus sp. DTU_2020_1000418_1_SI_GHA_SEK_038]